MKTRQFKIIFYIGLTFVLASCVSGSTIDLAKWQFKTRVNEQFFQSGIKLEFQWDLFHPDDVFSMTLYSKKIGAGQAIKNIEIISNNRVISLQNQNLRNNVSVGNYFLSETVKQTIENAIGKKILQENIFVSAVSVAKFQEFSNGIDKNATLIITYGSSSKNQSGSNYNKGSGVSKIKLSKFKRFSEKFLKNFKDKLSIALTVDPELRRLSE